VFLGQIAGRLAGHNLRSMKYLLGFAKKVLLYYRDRIVEAFWYLLKIAGAVLVNGAIMIPLVYLTSWILTAMGFNMGLPPDALGEIHQETLPLVALCLAIGIFEETYFRYFVQDCLFTRYLRMPMVLAWVLASVMFGAIHLLNPGTWIARLPQAIGATGAGLWLGWIYRKKGLHFAILTHAIYDFILMAFL